MGEPFIPIALIVRIAAEVGLLSLFDSGISNWYVIRRLSAYTPVPHRAGNVMGAPPLY